MLLERFRVKKKMYDFLDLIDLIQIIFKRIWQV